MKNTVRLITYANRFGDGTIASLTDVLRTRFAGVYNGVHVLPFFTPFDGADAGFDPIDHAKVDPRLRLRAGSTCVRTTLPPCWTRTTASA